jgi:hypothetical protein
MPIFLVSLFILMQSYFIAELVSVKIFGAVGFQLNYTVVAAFCGAYIWVVSDFITRYMQRNMTSGDIYRAALRLFTAVAVGYTLSLAVKDEIAPLIAFCVGAFPLQTVQALLKKITERSLHVVGRTTETRNQLLALYGMEGAVADRIADAGISSVSELAYCDTVHVAMATNLSFVFINDMASQAIAWNYLGEKLNVLRPSGLRTAYEIHGYVEMFIDEDQNTIDEAEALLPKLATSVKMTKEGLWNVLQEIAWDPYTLFLKSALPRNQ